MGKRITFRSEAREKILRGATQIADAVRVTLGPKSKCVLIDKKWGKPIVCNDGVTIAKEFELEDPEENLGVQMIRQAAERTGEAVGMVPARPPYWPMRCLPKVFVIWPPGPARST